MGKKFLACMCAILLVMGGCSSTESSSSQSTEPQTGVYTATAQGRNGDVVVEVTLEGETITKVEVVSHVESEGIADPAIEQLPQLIVEKQSVGVDAISGATITSTAILTAVADCLVQAGLNLEDYQKTETVAKTEQELTADVLVIGGGGAGLSAAIEAANNGASVILIEKLASCGGSTKLSMGMVLRGVEEGEDERAMTNDEIYQQMTNYNYGNTDVNDAILRDYVDHLNENADWLLEQGFDAAPYFYQGWAPLSPTGDWENDATSAIVLVNGTPEYGKGVYIVDALQKAAEAAGVQIYLNTKGEELLTDENNAVTGAKAVDTVNNIEYTIHADAVVLATGSFGGDAEMLAEFSALSGLENGLGEYIGGAGNTADGIHMAEALGAKTGMYFTALSASEASTIDTTGGLYINENAEVLKEDGTIIENLYAAGEMANIVIMGDMYTMCGTYNGWSVYSGRIAGRNAASK